ncbi:ApbE family protein [Caenibius tardaugens NBRC 16725]|uniref:FAD:protein FMN transferase n=1 Tax=Caenibius tardaugens NBRC 16725 TaxID=1219035 RepID=U2Y8W8_9SPHN|nr:FAD:protein FMN transferase [Caenibius tardaugens]AZI37726.1 FAD:protein FMN transferase [Caenibius tardaugens NBRC 16725]GAD49716.1 ApbE family protein [Caenibius tardaugens NBRC 16725]
MITRCRPLLGTLVEITVPKGCEDAVGPAFAMIADLHARMSFHEPASDLAALRSAQPSEAVKVDRETVSVLRMAVALHEATDGLFDVAVGRALVRGRFLPRDGIMHLNRFTGTTADIEIIDDCHVRCHRRMLIDLGGIAKGHAVDRAVETLTAAGVPAGLVNAGGDLRTFGARDWHVQLRDADEAIRHVVTVKDCAVASSANLHNRRQVKGVPHGPHIGWNGVPVLTDQRVTVIAEWCVIADAMTKVAMVNTDLADEILKAHRGYVLRDAMLVGAA